MLQPVGWAEVLAAGDWMVGARVLGGGLPLLMMAEARVLAAGLPLLVAAKGPPALLAVARLPTLQAVGCRLPHQLAPEAAACQARLHPMVRVAEGRRSLRRRAERKAGCLPAVAAVLQGMAVAGRVVAGREVAGWVEAGQVVEARAREAPGRLPWEAATAPASRVAAAGQAGSCLLRGAACQLEAAPSCLAQRVPVRAAAAAALPAPPAQGRRSWRLQSDPSTRWASPAHTGQHTSSKAGNM